MAAVNLNPSSNPAPGYNTTNPLLGTGSLNAGWAEGSILPAGAFSVEIMVRTTVSGRIMVATGQSYVGFIGMQSNGNAFAHYGSSQDIELGSSVAINDVQRHHLRLCYSPTTGGKFFVDGVLVSQSASTPAFNTGNKWAVGNFGDSYSYPWTGDLDELVI